MKNIKLFMCLAFIAFTFPALAQQPATFSADQDTVLIRLQGRNQVHIVGKKLRTLATYERTDSLKAFFFADLEKSLQNGSFPELPKRIHYFVSTQGKRRLKAEINEEYAAKFDLAYEKTRMNLDLPPLHYTIYDLRKNVEIHFFLEDSLSFKVAQNADLTKALMTMKNDRKKLNGLTAYQLESTGFGFERRNPKKRASVNLEGFAHLGATLIGNQFSPVGSYDLFLRIPARSSFRLGFSYNAFILTEFRDGQFRSINPGTFWQGVFQSNLGLDKEQWFGISAGVINNKDENGLPENAFKFGFITDYNRNSFSLDFIYLDKNEIFKSEQKRNLMMLTYRRSIL